HRREKPDAPMGARERGAIERLRDRNRRGLHGDAAPPLPSQPDGATRKYTAGHSAAVRSEWRMANSEWSGSRVRSSPFATRYSPFAARSAYSVLMARAARTASTISESADCIIISIFAF